MINSFNKGDSSQKLSFDEALLLSNKIIFDSLTRSEKGIKNITSHLSKATGKEIRARLLIASAQDENGLVPMAAANFAAAIELLHLATLVHDDIIDDSPSRRGIESVQSKFGKRKAVITGDYLLCKSFSIASSSYKHTDTEWHSSFNLAKDFSKAASEICLGELRQSENNFNVSLGLFDYLKIISGKTASLFYLSAFAGAAASKIDDMETKKLLKFGRLYGLLFQVIDDCRDYEGRGGELKPIYNDIKSGVITLPFIIAASKNSFLKSMAKEVFEGQKDSAEFVNEVNNLGGLLEAKNFSKKIATKAENILDSLQNRHRKDRLLELIKITV